jgi:hypothetical protein
VNDYTSAIAGVEPVRTPSEESPSGKKLVAGPSLGGSDQIISREKTQLAGNWRATGGERKDGPSAAQRNSHCATRIPHGFCAFILATLMLAPGSLAHISPHISPHRSRTLNPPTIVLRSSCDELWDASRLPVR